MSQHVQRKRVADVSEDRSSLILRSESPRSLRLFVNLIYRIHFSEYIRASFLNNFSLPLYIYTSEISPIDFI